MSKNTSHSGPLESQAAWSWHTNIGKFMPKPGALLRITDDEFRNEYLCIPTSDEQKEVLP